MPEKRVTLESHLSKITTVLESKQKEILELKDELDVDIFCSLTSDNGQGGAVVTAELMNLLSPFQVNVVFDLYMEPEEE
ncbi:hypothetical protein P20652_2603 [Pseudoalteromonas sp. BSi20652]|uniref:DUF4279 domain-containing protein n=1 Tax=Pseudoalteromonas sp. BSi20652 TaxID=388384 RepID=UPI000231A115|nr:DUF4279 domain-containing protein [Pseudoalteromonas sp. BSi20652]GAA60737.1 hypothetical protein P20652_2603 [Pseudoalteromonas sp. BSi20652]